MSAQQDAPAPPVRPVSRSVVIASFATTLAIVCVLIVALLASEHAEAATYSVTLSGGGDWTAVTWTCTAVGPGNPTCAGAPYPGSGGIDGDVANVSGSGTLTVNSAIPGAVTLNMNSSTAPLTLASGGTLKLTGLSRNDNSATTVNGGQLIINSGASFNVGTSSGIAKIVLNSGTLTNNGTLTFEASMPSVAQLDFNGGVFAGGGTTFTQEAFGNYAALNFTGTTGTMTIDAQQINHDGVATLSSSTNALTLTNGARLRLNTTGVAGAGAFNITGTTSVIGGATGVIDIQSNGLLQRSGGTGTFTINPAVNISSGGKLSVNVGGSTMDLVGGGTSSGSYETTATGSGIRFAGGTHTLNTGADFPGLGSVTVQGATVTIPSGNSVTVNRPFTFASGTINGGGTLTLNNNVTWTGGTMTGGGTTVTGTATTAINPSTAAQLNARTFTTGGVTNYTPGTATFQIGNGSVFNNGSTFNFTSAGSIVGFGSTSTFNNNGTFTKSSAGVSEIQSPINFNNNTPSGNLNIAAGTLELRGATNVSTSTISISSGATLDVPAGSLGLDGGTVSGLGTLRVNGGTLQANANVTVPNVAFSAGTITGASPNVLTIGSLTWSGGVMSGSGGTTVTGTSTVSPTAPAQINGRTFTNSGTFNYTPGAGILSMGNAATFVNGNTFNFLGAGAIGAFGSASTFTNNSAFSKNSPGLSEIQSGVNFNNAGPSGTLSVLQGTLELEGAANTNGNAVSISAGATLDLPMGVLSHNAGTFSGAGTLRVNGGTFTVNSSVSVPNVAFSAGTINGGSPNALTISQLAWTGGTMSGTGSTSVNGSAAITPSTVTQLNGRTLSNASAITYTPGAFTFDMGNGATLNNNGLFDFKADGGILGFGSAASFVNTGTGIIRKSVGTGASMLASGVNVTNTGGTIDVQTGILDFKGANVNAGAISIATGSELVTSAGTFDINAGTTVTGNGVLEVAGGTMTLNIPLTLTTNGFKLMSGTLTGGNLTLNANSLWGGGTMSGTGTTTVSAGTFTISGGVAPMTLNRALVNGSTVSATANASVGGTGTITNNATWSVNSAGTFNLVPVFNNNGTVTVASGTFSITGGGSHAAASSVGGGGAVEFNGGATTISGTYNPAGTILTGGTVSFGGPASTNNLLMTTGTLTGAGTFTVNTSATWNGGTMSGGGTTVIPAGVTMNISGAATNPILSGRTLNNSGTINYAPSFAMSLDSGSTINNNSGGVFDLKNDAPLGSSGITTFNNSGTFTKTAGAAQTSFGPAFNNASSVNLPTGRVDFNGGFTQTAGSTAFNGPVGVAGTMMINAGTLTANGTLTGSLSIGAATFNPGLSPGSLNISGNYTQGPSGVMNAELGGTTAGSTYDQVNVSGSVTLDGTLNASLFGGFTPANGNTFDILTFGSRSPVTTDFATKNLPTFAGGGSFTSTYLANALRLTAVVIQADLQVTKSAAATTISQGQNAIFTVTVSNLGPSTATNVTLSDTFSGGTFVSAASSQGTCSGTGPVNCSLGTLASSASATVTITINGNAVGTISNSASASATEVDPVTTNNSASASVAVGAAADLGISIADSPDPINAGDATTYTVTVNNAGPATASSVSVNLTLTNGSIASFGGGSFTCSGTTTSLNCTAASFPSGASNAITITASAGTASPMTLSGTISSATGDPNGTNNSASQATTVNSGADVSISKSGPSGTIPGSQVTFNISVTNLGPLAAANVVVDDSGHPRLTLVSVSGACSALPCSLGTMNASQTASFDVTYQVAPGGPQLVSNTASVNSSTSDPNMSNNSATAVLDIGCSANPPTNVSIAQNQTNVPTSGTITWTGNGASLYTVYLGKADSGGCVTVLGTTSSTSFSYSNLAGATKYQIRIESSASGCLTLSTPCIEFTTAVTCATPPPTLLEPAPDVQLASPVTFKWTAVTGATKYTLKHSVNGVAQADIDAGTNTEVTTNVASGSIVWSVVAVNVPGCGDLQSQTRGFSTCNLPDAPLAGVVGSPTSGQPYILAWNLVATATSYEVEEADNSAFAGATKRTVTTTSTTYTYTATTGAVVRFYRVFAINSCGRGSASPEVRVVTVPLPPPDQPNPNVNAPVGSTTVIIQKIFFPGFPDGNYAFTATVDKPWLQVSPASGVLTPNGITLDVLANPTNLPNGTITGTITFTASLITNSTAVTHATTTVSKPVSVNLVTPVVPSAPSTPPANALVIPSVGHLDGINNTRWQSDIRVTNTSSTKVKYQITFTPSGTDAAKGVKTTNIDVDAGATTALDDIVRNWYGIGAAGDSANGVLEIRPLSASGNSRDGAEPDNGVSLTTVASSRTYNVTSNGTLGQYIPALPFSQFIGKAAPGGAATVLSLQQIAQSQQFRTNLGVVEAANKSASAIVTFFGSNGSKVLELPIELKPGEQRQLNAILAQNRITLPDGRAEVKVTGGDGKVTAYASVIDNVSGDPLLVTGMPVGATASKWVLPGVADINTGAASWRTDMRIFNSGATPQNATVTFYSQSGGAPSTANITVEPNQVKVLDNVLASLFGVSNNGGAVHVTTQSNSALVVTGRTYNLTSSGTFGQFIQSVTPDGAIGKESRPLEILQVEESVRYRTNVGIAETSGKPATVELMIHLPDSATTPRVQIPLEANQFLQLPVISGLGLSNIYNARVTVSVVGGDGRVTAYGSVIDRTTQDPTYVPAQQ